MPVTSDREYRDLVRNLEIRKAEDGEPNEKIVEGYATTYNDKYLLYSFREWDGYLVEVWEQVDPNAFDECDMSDVIMQYDHEGRVFARQSNNTLRINSDTVGLHIEANLGGTEIGRQLFEEIEGGYTNKMSFGFKVGADKREEEVDEENAVIKITRTITKITKLFDVSAVSLPANNGTSISSRNYCEGVIAEVKEEFLKRQEIRKNKERERLILLAKSLEV